MKFKNRQIIWIFWLTLVGTLSSCVTPVRPGFYPGPLGPRVIQAPAPNPRISEPIPERSNFVQSYSNHKKTKAHSKFGALVRSIEFEYDISDSILISVRMTSGYDEGEITGLVTMMLDQYELTYENKNTQVREYIEQLSYEMVRPQNNSTLMVDPVRTAVNEDRSKKNERDKIVQRSQLFNQVTIALEREDARFITRSKSLYFIVQMDNCEIAVYPEKEQLRYLKRMITKFFRD